MSQKFGPFITRPSKLLSQGHVLFLSTKRAFNRYKVQRIAKPIYIYNKNIMTLFSYTSYQWKTIQKKKKEKPCIWRVNHEHDLNFVSITYFLAVDDNVLFVMSHTNHDKTMLYFFDNKFNIGSSRTNNNKIINYKDSS